jgi:hypothetical protein
MQNLSCKRIQCGEIWSYVKVKQGHITKRTPRARVAPMAANVNGRLWSLEELVERTSK